MKKTAFGVIGGLVALIALGLIVGGSALLWAHATQRSADGFFESPTVELATTGYALTTSSVDLGSRPEEWLPAGPLATVTLDARSGTESPVFVGVAAVRDVEQYLDGVAHSNVTTFDTDPAKVTYEAASGNRTPSGLPSEQGFWLASVEGPESQHLMTDVSRGEWMAVIMNADASPMVEATVVAGVAFDWLVPLAIGLLVGGLVFAAGAVALIAGATRTTPESPVSPSPQTTRIERGSYPLTVEAELDPKLEPWMWLIKWGLAIPHLLVLALLWPVAILVTVVAGVAILFTGRYPRSLFDFNVGVMRWTWRVTYYAFGVLGTDQYPPFTLADVDYPTRLDVEYPQHLSRGKVFVKWILAIPHYLVVGALTTGLVLWATQLGTGHAQFRTISPGLIGILALIAVFTLGFRGRYPQPLFDLLMGLNRWVLRVWTYVALMTDEYPPFRLDNGGHEHDPAPSDPRTGPGESEIAVSSTMSHGN